MTAIIIILALVAAVWGAIALVRGPLLIWCVAFLVVTCCFGHQYFNVDLGPIPFTIDRLFAGLVVAAYIVQRKLGRADPKPLTRADWLLFAFVGLLIVSTLSVDFMAGQGGLMPPIMRLIVGYLIPITMYWIARQSTLTAQTLKGAYVALAVFGVYLGVTAVLEVAQQWSLVFPHYISDPKIGLHYGRARGPMVHSVSLGLYLCGCCLCAWLLWSRVNRTGQLLILLLTPLMLAATFLTYTRSAWIGLAAGTVILLAMTLRGRLRTAMLGSVGLAAVLLLATKMDSIVGFQRELTVADTRKSVTMRGSFTYVSWKMFLDRPILGFGFGEFYNQKLPYLSDRNTDFHLEEIRGFIHHNTLLSLLTELGIVGLILFVAMHLMWVRYAWLLWRNGASPRFAQLHAIFFLTLLAAYAFPLVFHELSYTSIDNALVFMMAGVTVGLHAAAKRDAVSAANRAA